MLKVGDKLLCKNVISIKLKIGKYYNILEIDDWNYIILGGMHMGLVMIGMIFGLVIIVFLLIHELISIIFGNIFIHHKN